jgi:GcrA cell cycle regulator
MDWTESLIGRLRSLWDEDHSTAKIARIMGISKNAVVGKAHRLNLASRPSPIRRDGPARAPRPRRIRQAATLAPLPSVEPAPLRNTIMLAVPLAPAVAWGPDIRRLRGRRTALPNAQIFPPTRIAVTPPLPDKCTWPLWGHADRPTHKYCEAPAAGRWCEDHCKKGYERRPLLREEFAA